MIEQRDERRFLEALGPACGAAGAGDAGAPVGTSPWPEAVARAPFYFGEPIEAQWLNDDNIGAYLATLREAGTPYRSAAPPPVCCLPRKWHAATYPLLLSEFLAYKSALVYREPKVIRAHLLGASPRTGVAFCAGITTAAFFDTAGNRKPAQARNERSDAATNNRRPGKFQRPPSVRYGDTQALAFAANGTGYIVLRGTESFAGVAASLSDTLTDRAYPKLPDGPQSLVGALHPARRTGHAIAWGTIEMDLEAWVREQMRAGRVERLVLSGHALGGALAILGAYHFAKRRICQVHAVITFAAPKVGGEEFRRAYETPVMGLRERTLCLQAADDQATMGDHRFDGLVDVGHVWRFGKRVLRPWWQMLLWAPLVDPAASAERKLARARTRQAGKQQRHYVEAEGANPVSGHNRPADTAYWSWSGSILALILKLSWLMTRNAERAWRARRLERNYGLYLSTLSYRKIRAHHAALARLRLMTRRSFERENVLMEKAFRGANRDFANHLAFMRGRHPRTFRHLANRPIRVHTLAKVTQLEKKFTHYIV